MWERIELITIIIVLKNKVKWAKIREGCCEVLQLYGTTIIYNSTETRIIWQEIYDLDNQNRKYMIKSSMLLEQEWNKRRKIKIQYERENKEKRSNNAIKHRNKMKKTKQKKEK